VKKDTLLRIAGVTVIAAGIVLAVGIAQAPRATRVKTGQIAPDAELAPAEPGPPQHLTILRGSPTVLAFFETSTPKGQEYMRELEAIQRRYGRAGLAVAGVSLDVDRTPLLEFMQREQVSFTVFHDPNGQHVAPAWGQPQPMETYLLDSDGRVVEVYLHGVHRGLTDFVDRLKPMLKPL
jgi:peroxiredoxin